jgi:signal transduction histidine kinase
MGLWISRSIIEAHGGRLSTLTNDGSGATFQIMLPVEAELAAGSAGPAEISHTNV